MTIPPGEQSLPPPLPPTPGRSATLTMGMVGLGVCIIVGLVVFLHLMSWKIGFVIGLALIVLGGWLAQRQHLWLKSAQVSPGVVIALEKSSGRKSSTYRPRLRYTTRAGDERVFVDGIGSSTPEYKVGEKVLIAYDAANPADERLLAFGARFGYAALCVAAGIGLALLSAMIVAGRIALPQIYAPDQAAFLGP